MKLFNSLGPSDAYMRQKINHIVSDNVLSPGRCRAIIWTITGMFSLELLETNFSEILIEIRAFSFKKKHLRLSPAELQPFCLGLYV